VTNLRTVTIGLDGCSWNVLEPLLAGGELPHLEALVGRAARGVLESTIPFFTGPAWASYSTGCGPAGHGIYDFMMLRDGGRLSVARQDDLRRGPYYTQLGREGRRSVLINLPLDQDGATGCVIVNSWLTDDETRRILPVHRGDRYRRLLDDYRVFPQMRGANITAHADELCALERTRFDLARELFLGEDWDHFFVLFSSTDWLGHVGLGHLLAGDPAALAAFTQLYRQLDEYIGWFVERAPDALFAVLSDHGQTPERHVLRVNRVLDDLGLLALRNRPPGPSPFFVDRREQPRATIRVPASLARQGRRRALRPLAAIAKRALRRGLDVQLTGGAIGSVDRTASPAFCPTDASFAIHAPGLELDGLAAIRDALLGVELPDGDRAVEAVYTHEELYGRPPGPNEPTLVFVPRPGVRPSAALREALVEPPNVPGSGCHQRDGIVLLAGPGVAPGDLGRASICDVAPTLLWAMEAGVPAGADGRVLYEAFDPAFADVRELREVDDVVPPPPPGVSRGTGVSGDVERRLRDLGYL
jgi:predicted AlkP superfamily phosphohydrolase/phosphomutase